MPIYISYLYMLIQVSDIQLASQRPRPSQSDSSGTAAGGKQPRVGSVGKEKSPSRQAAAQERIRAKLIAISEQSVAADVKRSQPTQSRDTKISSRARSPSPKRHVHVRVHENVESA